MASPSTGSASKPSIAPACSDCCPAAGSADDALGKMLGATLQRVKLKPCAGKWILIALLLAALTLLLSVNLHQARTLERQRITLREVLEQRKGADTPVPGPPSLLRRITFPRT